MQLLDFHWLLLLRNLAAAVSSSKDYNNLITASPLACVCVALVLFCANRKRRMILYYTSVYYVRTHRVDLIYTLVYIRRRYPPI